MGWNPFKSAPKDIELPSERKRDPRLPAAPRNVLKEMQEGAKVLKEKGLVPGLDGWTRSKK